MAVGGLAEGFLAGFGAMNDYYRGQRADERADKELGLRDAYNKQQQDNWTKDYALRVDDQKNTIDRQKVADQQWADDFNLRKSEAETRRREAGELSALRWAQENRAAQEFNIRREQEDRSRFQQDNQALFQTGYQALANGEEPPAAFWQAAQDPRAGQYNPTRYITSEYSDAGKAFVQGTGALMRDAEAGKLDWRSEEGVKRINSQSILKSAGVLYQDEINTGIGGIDPQTGKTIKSKELNRIMVTDDGAGVVLGLKVTYDDGSTAERPVTQNRSTDPNDQPKVIPLSEFVGTGYKRALLSKQMQERAGQVSQALGLSEGPDTKGYRQAVVKIQAETNKNIAAIQRDPMVENKEEAIAAERQSAKEQIDGMRDVFGIDQQKKKGGGSQQSGGDNLAAMWAGGDQSRQAFISEAMRSGVEFTDKTNMQVLEGEYRKWMAGKNATNTAGELRGDGAAQKPSLAQALQSSKGQRSAGLSDQYRQPLNLGGGNVQAPKLSSEFSLPQSDAYVPEWARGYGK